MATLMKLFAVSVLAGILFIPAGRAETGITLTLRIVAVDAAQAEMPVSSADGKLIELMEVRSADKAKTTLFAGRENPNYSGFDIRLPTNNTVPKPGAPLVIVPRRDFYFWHSCSQQITCTPVVETNGTLTLTMGVYLNRLAQMETNLCPMLIGGKIGTPLTVDRPQGDYYSLDATISANDGEETCLGGGWPTQDGTQRLFFFVMATTDAFWTTPKLFSPPPLDMAKEGKP